VDDTGKQDEAVYFVHTDHLATPQKITDSAQTVVWSGSYEPFGEVEETVNIIENNIRFPGQYADAETGLHYNYFRDYDPSLGRYVESDPIGLSGGLNTYGYVVANPLTFSDPMGLDATSWGRNPFLGPSNGNWGGKCWSGGRYSCGSHEPGNLPPTDDADRCYMQHDLCYVRCNNGQCSDDSQKANCIRNCDRALPQCLRQLHQDPKKWDNPPKPGTEGDTQRFRWAAEQYF